MSDDLKIGHWNVFAANPEKGTAARAMVATDCDSFGVNEGNRMVELFRAMTRYRVTVSPGTGRDRETPILTRRALPTFGSMALRLCDPAEPDKWAPARWGTVALFEHPAGRIAHVNVHLNAVVTDVPPSLPRVRQYAASTEALGEMVRFLERLGFVPVVTGDVNMTVAAARSHSWSAHQVLEGRGLQVRTRGVELVAWPDDRLKLTDWDVTEPGNGSNHPMIVTTFKARR